MNREEKKNVLLMLGMEQNPEIIMNRMPYLHSKNIFSLPYYGTSISPFGDIMRSILIAVYKENVEEIVVAVSNDDQNGIKESLKKIDENIDLQKKIQSLDYLFKNCMPEFPKGTVKEWLEGSETSSGSIKSMIDVIRNHPLMPSDVKVTELMVETEKLSKMAGSFIS